MWTEISKLKKSTIKTILDIYNEQKTKRERIKQNE